MLIVDEREVTYLPLTHSSISKNKSTGTNIHVYFPVVVLLMNRPKWQIVLFRIYVPKKPTFQKIRSARDSVRAGQSDSRDNSGRMHLHEKVLIGI